MFYGLDPLYFMILGPSLLLAAWASGTCIGLRNGIVPLATWGGNLSWILIVLGFALASLNLIRIGIAAVSLTVLFSS